MSDTRLTDERLRTHLDANQVQRERMCLALLALLGDYTRIEPRRPKGGPDGSRDIQARLLDGTEVWGGVGFQNQVSDSLEDKRNAKKKFRMDLDAAIRENPPLPAFVFFTNVDLTPGEVEELKALAYEQGVNYVDIFWRERLRMALDSPQGFGYRLQYLDIEMSKEEQVAFVETVGKKLELMLIDHHWETMDRIYRIEFQNRLPRAIQKWEVFALLKPGCKPETLGHFRILCKLKTNFPDQRGRVELNAAARDAYGQRLSQGRTEPVFGHKEYGWSTGNADVNSFNYYTTKRLTDAIVASTSIGPYRTMEELEATEVELYVTESLVDHLLAIGFSIDEYVLMALARGTMVTSKQLGIGGDLKQTIQWPEQLTTDEDRVEWVRLEIPQAGVDPFRKDILPRRRVVPQTLLFSQYTPVKKDDYLSGRFLPRLLIRR